VLLAMLTAQMPFGAQTEETSRALAAAGRFCVPSGISDAALDLLASILQPDPTLRVTLDELWRHPWMRTSSFASASSSSNSRVDRGSTTRSATREEANHKPQERRKSEKSTKEKGTRNKKKNKREEKNTDEEQPVVDKTSEEADVEQIKNKKRSRVHRAASLLFRRTTAVIGAGGKKRGRSTSAMASASSSLITLSNDRVRTLATT
jgi:serine/threonine protein kinase